MLQTSEGGPATFNKELRAPREALKKAGPAKCGDGVQGKKHVIVKNALSNPQDSR